MVRQGPVLWTVVITLGSVSCKVVEAADAQVKVYNSSTELLHINTTNSEVYVLQGTTILLVCTVSPSAQNQNYRWMKGNSNLEIGASGSYVKVHNSFVIISAIPAAYGPYKCKIVGDTGNEAKVTLKIQGLVKLPEGTLALYNRSKLLLQNTLITNPGQIPYYGLACRTGRNNRTSRFRFEDGSTVQTQSARLTSAEINQNGRYVCFDGGREWPIYIYFHDKIISLPTPEVKAESKDQLHRTIIRPINCSRGRLILRYDCGLRGIPIELEYKSVEISSGSSDVVVTRSRSCFVVGELSRVTVWFICGGNISFTPAVVNVSSGEEFPTETSTSLTPARADTSILSTVTTGAGAGTLITGTLTAAIGTPSSIPEPPSGTHPSKAAPTIADYIPFIGGAAGGVILLLVGVLVLIICTIGLVRRGKSNRTTHHEHSLYYSTVQEGGQHKHNTPPQVELQIDNFNTGGFYDEVEVKVQPTPAAEPSEYQLVDDTGDVVKLQKGDSETKDTAVANPEDLYAQPVKKSKKNKSKVQDDGEKKKVLEEVQDPELLYAVVDKPKKKKGKDKKTKEKDDLEQQQGELLYAEVNKPKKKGKKDKKRTAQKQEIPQNEKEVTPPPDTPTDTGLAYEPSADSDDTQHEQDGEVNTTQPTLSANVEGLYTEVDKTQKKQENK